jgi:hypothetical protein
VGENCEASFEYAENMLDDIVCASVSKIEEFLFISGPESNEKVIAVAKQSIPDTGLTLLSKMILHSLI